MGVETVAVIDPGGRGQAFAHKFAESKKVREVLVIPGNGGTDRLSRQVGKPIRNIEPKVDSVGSILDIIRKTNAGLVIVGPEAWLEKGLGDALEEEGVLAIAPQQDRAVLETSKVEARKLNQSFGVSQPEYEEFRDERDALEFVYHNDIQEGVVKASKLAGGKGVTVCFTQSELIEAIAAVKQKFGPAAEEFLIEERLSGPEISYIVFCDGENFYPLVPAMDFKALSKRDKTNTGGMASISPNPIVTLEMVLEIEDHFVRPILEGMKSLDRPYKGILYVSLMEDVKKGLRLIELNARGGDTETQTQLQLLGHDLYDVSLATATKTLDQLPPASGKVPKAAATIVLAAEGYPDAPKKGAEIYGLDNNYRDVQIYHAGTKDDRVNGGRVINLTATGESVEEAVGKIYPKIGQRGIHFEGMQYRDDIGG